MKTIYEVHHSWTETSRFGGTQLDYDVYEGSEVAGRFETREAAEVLVQQLLEKYPSYREEPDGRSWGNSYEIKEVGEAQEPPGAEGPGASPPHAA